MPSILPPSVSVHFHRAGIKNEGARKQDALKQSAGSGSRTLLFGGRIEIVTKARKPVILRPEVSENPQSFTASPTRLKAQPLVSVETTRNERRNPAVVAKVHQNWIERLQFLERDLARQKAQGADRKIIDQHAAVTDELQKEICLPSGDRTALATRIATGAMRLQALELDLSLSRDKNANLRTGIRNPPTRFL